MKANKLCGKMLSNEVFFSNSCFSEMKAVEKLNIEGIDYSGPVKTRHKILFLSTKEKLMKQWPSGSHVVMNGSPIVTVDRTLMSIRYRYRYQKVIVFNDMDCARSNKPGVPYLSRYPDNYSNISICPVIRPHFIGIYCGVFNAIDNHNRMHQYDLALDKHWVKNNGYFRLATTVALVVGITYGKLILCHGISEQNMEKINQ